MPTIDFRVPLYGRIVIAVFGTALCGFLLAALISAIVDPGEAYNRLGLLEMPFMIAIVGAMFYRYARLAAIEDGDELVVRNVLRNHRVPRGRIQSIGSGAISTGGGWRTTLTLETDTDAVPLDVLAKSKSHYRRGDLEPMREALQTWATEGK